MQEGWDKPLWISRLLKQNKQDIMDKLDSIENIFKKAGDATATDSDIVKPKTAYNGNTLLTGTLEDKTGTTSYTANTTLDSTNKLLRMQVPSVGKYGVGNYLQQSFANIANLIGLTSAKLLKNNTVLGITGNSSNMDTSACDAAAAQILSGKKAGVKGNTVTGTMANKAGTTVKAAAVTQDDNNTYFTLPAAGYYDTASKVYTENSNLKSLKIVQFETGGNGDYKTANIIFDVSDFSKLHIGAIGGIGSGNFAVYGGSGINIVNGITQSTLTNSATLETISDGGGTEKEYDISEYSYVRLYIKGTPSGYSYIKYMNDISFS